MGGDADIVGVANPLAAFGGIDPETGDEIRRDAPATLSVQERAVTASDYAAKAELHPGVEKAAATFRWTGSWHTVFVTADRRGGRAVDAAFEDGLRAQLERYRIAGYDLEVNGPVFVPLEIALFVCVDRGHLRSAVARELQAVLSDSVLADGRSRALPPRPFHVRQACPPVGDPRGRPLGARRRVGRRRELPAAARALVQRHRIGSDPDGTARDRAARQRSELPRTRGARAELRRRIMSTHRSACGCAACRAAASPPLPVANRPGLRSITYRSGTHGDFLSAMIAGLSRATSPPLGPSLPAADPLPGHEGRPGLRGLRTRETDDVTIALLDAFAVTADILTFYSERLANESYLGTANERTSLQELGALVAYRLGRGAAAETMLAFSLERPPTPLPESMRDPGIAPPAVPVALTLPAALRVQSVPGPDEQPQTFETVEQIEARPEWNALPVARTIAWPVTAATKEAWFEGTDFALDVGDTLLLTSHDATGEWDVLPLVAVDRDRTAGRTRATWANTLKPSALPLLQSGDFDAFVLRKRLSLFGHNAPRFAVSDPAAPTYDAVDSDPAFVAAFDVRRLHGHDPRRRAPRGRRRRLDRPRADRRPPAIPRAREP